MWQTCSSWKPTQIWTTCLLPVTRWGGGANPTGVDASGVFTWDRVPPRSVWLSSIRGPSSSKQKKSRWVAEMQNTNKTRANKTHHWYNDIHIHCSLPFTHANGQLLLSIITYYTLMTFCLTESIQSSYFFDIYT